MYKHGVGDFPLVVIPCEYWWCRYTTACTKFEDIYAEYSRIWKDCEFENDDQSKCSHYKESEFYKNMSLEELRNRKGYEV